MTEKKKLLRVERKKLMHKILPCSKDFLETIIPILKEKIESETRSHTAYLYKMEKERYEYHLNTKKELFIPDGDFGKILPGNGGVIKIDGKAKEFFYDTFHIGKCNRIVSIQTILGKAIFKKVVGDKGRYSIHGKTHTYEIVEIWDYYRARAVLKNIITKEILSFAA